MDQTGTGHEGLPIRHVEEANGGAFVIEQGGRRVGELAWDRGGPGVMIIEHTQVDEVLRGTGAGRQLVDAAADWARRAGMKIAPFCPYAKKVMERDARYRDVLR